VPEAEVANDVRARSFWSGVLSFGLVSIPVDLLPAHRGTGGGLRLLDEDGTPLARRYFCPTEDKQLEAEDLVHGYELDNGKLVVATDEELAALAPKKSREIDLRLFVDRDSIDPLYFERSYFLLPGAQSGKAYRLLAAVMERSRRAGIASFVMREREYLVAIFADHGLLHGETLRFASEVRSAKDVGLPRRISPEPQVLARIRRTVEALEQKSFNTSSLRDPREALRKLAEEKYRHKRDVVRVGESSAASGAPALDLMEVLRQSLAESGLAKVTPASRGRRAAPKRSRKATQRPRRTVTAGR
jgi:DNA end-binding protein Ku